MRLGLLADTHGLVDPALPRALEGCQKILHAGDVVGSHVLDALQAIAPVHAVRGNNDTGADLPEHLTIELGSLRVLVLHQLGRPGALLPSAARQIEAARPDLVLFGHSHVPIVERRGGTLFVNPGSCGPRRFHLPRCAATLDIDGPALRIHVVDLDRDLATVIDARP